MSVISQAKYYFSKLNIENGWNDQFVKGIMGPKYTEEKVDFFKRFYGCLLGEKFCNKMTGVYIKTPLLSMRDSISEFNRQNPNGSINENTALSQINYCSSKLKGIFKDENMLNIIWSETGAINKKYLEQLNEFIIQYGVKGKQTKEFSINIPSYKRSGKVTDEEFVSFLRLIEPYSKNYMREVQKEINSRTNEVGYFNYIMKPDIRLTTDEQKHKELVEIMLGQRKGELPIFGVGTLIKEDNLSVIPDILIEDVETESIIKEEMPTSFSEEEEPVVEKPKKIMSDIIKEQRTTEYGNVNRVQF